MSKAPIHASHEGGTGHGIAQVYFIFLGQEILSTNPQRESFCYPATYGGVKKREVFLLLRLTHFSVKTIDILQTGMGCPNA